MRVFIDSGGFLAVTDRNDPFHPVAREVTVRLEAAHAHLFTSNFVVDEACTLVRARTNHAKAVQFLQSLKTSGIDVLRIAPRIEVQAERIFIRHADKDFSFTDCTSFALIEAKHLNAFLAFDQHFRQYRFRHPVIDLAQTIRP